MVRKHLVENPQVLKAMLENPGFSRQFTLAGEKLKNVPRGYGKNHPMAEYLKHKSWYVEHPFTKSSCTLPWIKDDPDDGPLYEGIYWSDPAFFIDTHLNGLGTFSHEYVYNPYYTHKITVTDITSCANKDPFGDKSDVFMKISVGGLTYINSNHWKDNQAPKNTTKQVFWGKEQAEFGDEYSEAFSTIYFARPDYAEVKIEVLDKDGTSGDDTMGHLSAAPAPGQTVTWKNQYTSTKEARLTAVVEAR